MIMTIADPWYCKYVKRLSITVCDQSMGCDSFDYRQQNDSPGSVGRRWRDDARGPARKKRRRMTRPSKIRSTAGYGNRLRVYVLTGRNNFRLPALKIYYFITIPLKYNSTSTHCVGEGYYKYYSWSRYCRYCTKMVILSSGITLLSIENMTVRERDCLVGGGGWNREG